MLSIEAENLDRIHEFHVVLAQSGLMKWCSQPYSFLGMRKSSEYSDEQRSVARPFRGNTCSSIRSSSAASGTRLTRTSAGA